jgi:DNA-binding GntR family transcriptional regulator
LSAKLKPGDRLKFPDLVRDYGTSVGVAREALTRLAADRFVVPQARQGYSVVELSPDELIDLTMARAELEGLVLSLAMETPSPQWEAAVIGAHHLLARTPLPDFHTDSADVAEWQRVHEAFHTALLSGCPSRRLRESAQSLRDEAELYRRWSGSLGAGQDRDIEAEHQAIADAVMAQDAAAAVALLRDHIMFTTRILLEGDFMQQGYDLVRTADAAAV